MEGLVDYGSDSGSDDSGDEGLPSGVLVQNPVKGITAPVDSTKPQVSISAMPSLKKIDHIRNQWHHLSMTLDSSVMRQMKTKKVCITMEYLFHLYLLLFNH